MNADVIIIGAGVVGCAVARELTRWNLNVLVLEAGSDVAEGASKANSAIVHAGFDAKPGTNKAKFNVLGNRMFEDVCRELKVPFRRNGSLVLAFGAENSGGQTPQNVLKLRPTLKLPPARFTLRRTRRHDKSAGQVRCLNTPLCMGTKPRPRASAQSCAVWWRRCSEVGLPRYRRGASAHP